MGAGQHARGQTAHYGGLAAEGIAERCYVARGWRVRCRRWRRGGGEIDLVMERADELAFVEVKKSRSFSAAAQRIGRRQMDRICIAAETYLGEHPGGPETLVRFDVALVDAAGRCEIVENAFGVN